MPRKHRSRHVGFSVHTVKTSEHPDPEEVTDHDLVRHALIDFDELAVLPPQLHKQLVADLVAAIRFWRAGIKPGKRGLSDAKEAQHIFISDVGRALERADLSAKRWRKTYDGDGGPDRDAPESLFFRLTRDLGDTFGRPLPKDLKLAGQRASKIEYEVMSPAMRAEQDVLLLAAGRRRLDKLSVRLKAYLDKPSVRLRAYVAPAGAKAVPKPETVYGDLPLELRLLVLGLSDTKTFGSSSALVGTKVPAPPE